MSKNVCKNMNFKYMNGINCIYLNYYRSEKDNPEAGEED